MHHLHHEMPSQTLPFPGARCAAGGGEFFVVASSDTMYALLPPTELVACRTAYRTAGSSASTSTSYAEDIGGSLASGSA